MPAGGPPARDLRGAVPTTRRLRRERAVAWTSGASVVAPLLAGLAEALLELPLSQAAERLLLSVGLFPLLLLVAPNAAPLVLLAVSTTTRAPGSGFGTVVLLELSPGAPRLADR